MTLVCAPGCVFLRVSNVGSDARVTFDGVTDAEWTGGTFLRTDDLVEGSIFSIKDSSRVTLRDFVVRGWEKDANTFISGWRKGRGVNVNGDDIRIYNPTIRDPYKDANGKYEVGSGGIRVLGGKRFLCIGGSIESGDDAMAFVPSKPGSDGNLDGSASVEDATISDMSLYSRAARAINFGLDVDDDESGPPLGDWLANTDRTPAIYQTASLRRCRMTNIDAQSDADHALFMRNDYSSGAIEDIELCNVALHCGPNAVGPILIRREAGPIRRIRFTNVSVFIDPASTESQEVVNIIRVDGFSWTGGRIDAPVQATEPTVKLAGVVGGSLRDLSIGCRSPEGVRFGMDNPAPTNQFGLVARASADVTIMDSVIENVTAGGVGLNFANAVNCGAVRVRFTDGITATATSVPHGGRISQLTAIDPAVSSLAPGFETYTVTIQPAPVAPETLPLFFTVFRSGSVPVGQGRLTRRFSSAGLSFLLEDGSSPPPRLMPGDSFTIKLQAAGGQAATLSTTSTACFLDACDISGLTTTAPLIDASAGRHHRIVDLYPFDTPTNYTGGLFEADNYWAGPQSFASATAKSLALGRASATINADKITATACIMQLTPESGTTDNLFTVDGDVAGTILILRTVTTGHIITIKDTNSGTAGNLHLAGGDFVLSTPDDRITLLRSATASAAWYELSRSDNLP